MVFCKVGVNVIYYGVLFCCWVVYELVCSYTFANFFCGIYVFVLYVNVNPGDATLQGVAIPLNQITFVAIYLALTAFAL